jgi:iron complex outermembrane receptor protein
MKRKLTPIASAVAVMMLSGSMAAQAQQASTATQPTEQVVVTGVRAALQKSLEQKRASVNDVEVITAEDVGKMPDKNVADALQRVPGVNTASQAGGEGGFDENDRVSIRGTSPSLTQVTINGHMVSSGDWFLLDQYQTVGRSVSFSLLPSELVQTIVVSKAPTADQIEGGVAGSVDIQTHSPLQFKDQLTAEATLGAVYASLPQKTDPQFNGMIAWKNDEKTFGALLEVFDEQRHSTRYGQEDLGYTTINSTLNSGAPNPIVAAHPDLLGVVAPTFIGSALFEQKRVRKGGDFAFEFKPSSDLSFNLNGFYSHMDANNSNINFLADVAGGGAGGFLTNGIVPSSYTVSNNTLTSATWNKTNTAAVVDNIYRVATSEGKYLDLDGKYRLNDRLTFTGKIGTTTGVGQTSSSDSWEANVPGTLSYQMNGISHPVTVNFPSGVPFSNAATGYLWTDFATSTDKENYGQFDGLLSMDDGVLDSIKFGARYAKHTHTVAFPFDGGPLAGAYQNVPVYSGQTYPGNFNSVLGSQAYGGGFIISQAAVTNFYNTYGKPIVNSSGLTREYWPAEENLTEDDSAGYVMGNLVGKNWSGNVGVRLVHTYDNVLSYQAEPGTGGPTTTAPFDPPGTNFSSQFGNFMLVPITHSYNNFLPSANFKFDLSKDLVAKFGVANTMSRPDYEALGGAVQLTDLTLAGSGGNPNLKPIRSTNWDGTLEWYFAPKSLVSASLFYMDFQSYVDFGTSQQVYADQLLKGIPQTYSITSPFNTSAKNDGFELSYQQTFSNGFGALANFTLANGWTEQGSPMVGNSKDTYNLTGFWEGYGFSARLAYTYKSASLVGLDRSFNESQAAIGNLALALNYDINKKLSVSFNALNLNNAPLEYYANNTTQPRAIYYNGIQYYLTLHAKL